jgi:lipopolysaccharide biosynthesis glycosyltransferase
MNEIHFVYCTDNEYAPYLGVSLASILLNAGADENLNVHIVNRGISSENRAKIASLKERRDFSLFFL